MVIDSPCYIQVKAKCINMDQKIGVEIIERACRAPVRAIANNAGFEGSVVVGEMLKTKESGIGFNALTGTHSLSYCLYMYVF